MLAMGLFRNEPSSRSHEPLTERRSPSLVHSTPSPSFGPPRSKNGSTSRISSLFRRRAGNGSLKVPSELTIDLGAALECMESAGLACTAYRDQLRGDRSLLEIRTRPVDELNHSNHESILGPWSAPAHSVNLPFLEPSISSVLSSPLYSDMRDVHPTTPIGWSVTSISSHHETYVSPWSAPAPSNTSSPSHLAHADGRCGRELHPQGHAESQALPVSPQSCPYCCSHLRASLPAASLLRLEKQSSSQRRFTHNNFHQSFLDLKPSMKFEVEYQQSQDSLKFIVIPSSSEILTLASDFCEEEAEPETVQHAAGPKRIEPSEVQTFPETPRSSAFSGVDYSEVPYHYSRV